MERYRNLAGPGCPVARGMVNRLPGAQLSGPGCPVARGPVVHVLCPQRIYFGSKHKIFTFLNIFILYVKSQYVRYMNVL